MAIQVKEVQAADQKVKLPAIKEHSTKFPKKTFGSAGEAKQALKEWQKQQPEPEAKKNPDIAIRALPLSVSNASRLAAVAGSDSAPNEIVNQKLDEEQFFGTLFSSLATFEYIRMEGEYKKRKATKQTAGTADRDWAKVVEGFQSAYAAAGMRVTPAQLSKFAKDLAGNKRNLEAVAGIANSATADKQRPLARSTASRGGETLAGRFETVAMRFIDPDVFTIVIPNLCSQPFAQGTFTKHWSKSWSLTVSLPYPCPTWTNPFRICWKTVTIASVSVDVGLNVGYKVNCCGASAWGQAFAQACASVVGVTKCVGCTATVVGVAGFARTPVGTRCNYGLGINASVQCQVFGATVFSVSWPFGYTVTGPCPPPGLC